MLYLKCNKNRKRVNNFMKKLNTKGFTLIELLAVITIMGILMVVAIPTVSRTIENTSKLFFTSFLYQNTRKDTFLDTTKQYVNSVKTMWLSDTLECKESTEATEYTPSTALPEGIYFVRIDSSKSDGNGAGTNYPILLESGGKSSWANKDVKGYVKVLVSANASGRQTVNYYVRLTDGTHGVIDSSIEYMSLKRGNVLTAAPTSDGPWGSGANLTAVDTPNSSSVGAVFSVNSPLFCKEV